jgi:hypothetical protein
VDAAPVVVVFTKYDQLLRSKMAELQEDDKSLDAEALDERSKEEAQKAFNICVGSLEQAMSRTKTPMPRYERCSSIISYSSLDQC